MNPHGEPSTAIGQRLRIAREQAGLSQSQVAKMLGYHRPSVSEMEAGRRRVTTQELARLAEIYGVTISWLMDEQQEADAKLQLVARAISKLREEDLDQLLKLLAAFRGGTGEKE